MCVVLIFSDVLSPPTPPLLPLALPLAAARFPFPLPPPFVCVCLCVRARPYNSGLSSFFAFIFVLLLPQL